MMLGCVEDAVMPEQLSFPCQHVMTSALLLKEADYIDMSEQRQAALTALLCELRDTSHSVTMNIL